MLIIIAVCLGMTIGYTYSVFHRILDLKTGVYFYTAPFFLPLLLGGASLFGEGGAYAGGGGKAKLQESFVDSVQVGRKGHNKVVIKVYSLEDSGYVVIRFYARSVGRRHWKLRQEFRYAKMDPGFDPELKDFNHDGFKDLTYISDIAVRGANERRRLFIYDTARDKLVLIRNSNSYANLGYNSYLNCIDAWLFTAGTETVFLRLKGDRLQEFASVSVRDDDGIWVSVVDRRGRWKVIKRMKAENGVFNRYKSYDPLIAY